MVQIASQGVFHNRLNDSKREEEVRVSKETKRLEELDPGAVLRKIEGMGD
jgi:hypothetical protein